MQTEIYIEKFPLDISNDISALLTFQLDDLKDFSSRSTTWSKTIILPGTANNNKLFGHIFQIGQSNQYDPALDNVGYNFNASKSADCIIFQDQMQTFIGVLRLMQININKGRIEYEVAVFGKLSGLNVSLSSSLLSDLDFSAYDDTYNSTNIKASWDNLGGSGVYYPLADYGQYSADKHSWDIRTFRPALYAKEYIDKMFSAAGFRYSSALFNTARFKSIIVPHNQKSLTKQGTLIATGNIAAVSYTAPDNSGPTGGGINIAFGGFSGTNWSLIAGSSFRYDAAPIINVNPTLHLEGNYVSDVVGLGSFIGIRIQLQYWPPPGSSPLVLGEVLITSGGAFTVDIPITNYTVTQTGFFQVRIIADDPLGAYVDMTGGYLHVDAIGRTVINVNPGDAVSLNDTIAKNIRQIDFLVSLVKLFNLYVYEDRFDPSLIYITPYIDFYSTDSADSDDWTYKLNREGTLQIKPMSEINAKKYNFFYKDDSDFWNDLYKKRYGIGYGSYIFDSQYEFAEQTKAFELIFSSTPLVGFAGEDKVYPTLYKKSNDIEEQMDTNIRIMLTKKVTGVTSWDILDTSGIIDSATDYGYAGHFDDPDDPQNDLNFGVPYELFFALASGDLTKTQFNVFWSGYMAEITDKDSKLVNGDFYLTPKDILELDFSRFKYVDGVLFRLSKITDYNASKPTTCKVELLKVNYLIY